MHMQSSNRELWYSCLAILTITLLYLLVVARLGGLPAAREFFGHSLGIVGFILMLMTESLYSIRKRSRRASLGRMSVWLQFHIFTGLVGPYLVLLHSSWKFNGLAGIVTLMTGITVLSGFIGRYIYTAVPRSMDGLEIETSELERAIRSLETELRERLSAQPQLSGILAPALQLPAGGSLALEHLLSNPGSRWHWWLTKRRLAAPLRAQAIQLEQLLRRRNRLERQVRSLALARRLLAVWHAIHIPLGMALFAAAFIHIAAAIYYATLLR
jgi:hypothetical protein